MDVSCRGSSFQHKLQEHTLCLQDTLVPLLPPVTLPLERCPLKPSTFAPGATTICRALPSALWFTIQSHCTLHNLYHSSLQWQKIGLLEPHCLLPLLCSLLCSWAQWSPFRWGSASCHTHCMSWSCALTQSLYPRPAARGRSSEGQLGRWQR